MSVLGLSWVAKISRFSAALVGVALLRHVKGVNTNCYSASWPEPSAVMATLEKLNFDNRVLRSLPLDSIKDNYVRQVVNACFSRLRPTPVDSPVTVAYSVEAMELLDLPESELKRPEFAQYFSGSKVLPGSEPASHCYCGHQFGFFSGQLGDGAAIYLGEVVNSKGQRWEVQMKGAGKTPYSRDADGRKVLRSSIREFLCSEAMYHLGVPTTRAGACVTSKTGVTRDIFYSGNPIIEKATIVTRIAPTFIRFGSFEIFKTRDPFTGRAGPSVGRHELRKQMLDYCISTFYPEIHSAHKDDPTEMYKEFYRKAVVLTARMVADWQCVGFCHGVLNTDNMSILGLTIDYGPFGFMDRYNPDNICNASDDGGRYSYIKQPEICRWNLEKFAEALHPALPLDVSKEELKLYDAEYKKHYIEKMRKKLGLLRKQLPEDEILVQSLLDTMELTGADFTNCFRGLSLLAMPGSDDHEESLNAVRKYLLKQCCSMNELKKSCTSSMDERQYQLLLMLFNTQPELLEQLGKGKAALEREMKRREAGEKLSKLTSAEKLKADEEHWDDWLKMYVERLQKELEGKVDVKQVDENRTIVMKNNNPRFILRNYIAQNAIAKAEKGDYSEVNKVLDILRQPFADLPGHSYMEEPGVAGAAQKDDSSSYDCRPPDWALDLKVT